MKSNNWNNLLLLGQLSNSPVRVEYSLSDLFLTETEQIIDDVETVVVIMKDSRKGDVYVGVSQTSPRDHYNKVLGREIAAGRALRAWYDEEIERELWESETEGTKVVVHGFVPEGVDVSDELLYG